MSATVPQCCAHYTCTHHFRKILVLVFLCNCVRRPPQLLNSHQTQSAHSASSYMHAFMHHSDVRNHLIWLRMRLVFHDVPTLALQCEFAEFCVHTRAKPRRASPHRARAHMNGIETRNRCECNAIVFPIRNKFVRHAKSSTGNIFRFGVGPCVLSSLHLFGALFIPLRRRCFAVYVNALSVVFNLVLAIVVARIHFVGVSNACAQHTSKNSFMEQKNAGRTSKAELCERCDQFTIYLLCEYFFSLLFFRSLNSCVCDSEVEIKRFLNFFRNAIGRTLIEWALCTWTLCTHLGLRIWRSHSAHRRINRLTDESVCFFSLSCRFHPHGKSYFPMQYATRFTMLVIPFR